MSCRHVLDFTLNPFFCFVSFENKIRIREVEEWELRGLVNGIVVMFAAMKLKL